MVTEYVVLQASGDDEWMVVDTVQARSATAAIRAAITGDGQYVAVPARSWQPVTAKTETSVRTVLA